MSKREIVIRIQLPRTPRMRWLVGGGVAVMLAGLVAYATTTWPANFMTGQPVSSGDLKFYLNDLNTRVTALTAAPTWMPLTLTSGWVVDPGYYTPSFTKTPDGFVHIRGLLKVPSGAIASGTIVATIPGPGNWPTSLLEFAVPGVGASGGAVVVDVDTSGNVKVYSLSSTAAYLGLDGIGFFAEH